MLWVIIVAGAYLAMRHFDGAHFAIDGDDLKKMNNPSVARTDLPDIIRDDIMEKSFFANQSHHTIRMPFGGNPDAKYINSRQFIDYPEYKVRYQQEQYRMRVKSQDWRMDVNFNSQLNNMLQSHMQEDYPVLIAKCSNSPTKFPAFEKAK